jgi:formylmethanofuran dehydrogenase subunit E
MTSEPGHMSSKYEGRLLLDGFDWETMRRFHGHLGPWMALGMKIGTHAFVELGFRPHFGVSVRVKGPLRRPITCMLDGLQWGTGATLGKGNITVEQADDLSVEITSERGGLLRYGLPANLADRFARLISEVGEDDATHAVWAGGLEEYCIVARTPEAS